MPALARRRWEAATEVRNATFVERQMLIRRTCARALTRVEDEGYRASTSRNMPRSMFDYQRGARATSLRICGSNLGKMLLWLYEYMSTARCGSLTKMFTHSDRSWLYEGIPFIKS